VALVAAVASRPARAAVEAGLEAAEEVAAEEVPAEEVPAAEPLLEGQKPMVVPAAGKTEELPDKRVPLAVAAWKEPAVVAPAPPPRF